MSENTSQKRVLIDKANSNMFIIICIASALVVFSLVSVRSLMKLSTHKSHVIKAKKQASTTLTANDAEIGKLITSFKAFEGAPESVMGTAEKNSKIVLDALPPKYDFPALASSLEKILSEGGYNIVSITGTDNEAAESSVSSSSVPVPVEIPFSLTVSGPYDKVKNLPADLERSIRPIYILSMSLSGSAGDAKISITAKTFYQAGKNLELQQKEVK